MNTFEKVRKYLASIPHINAGGCGIAAYAMYLWLVKNNQLPEDFKFALLYRGYLEEEYNTNINISNIKRGIPHVPSHICIFYNNSFIDSDSIVDITTYKYVQFVEEEWFIVSAINNIKDWNNMFNRNSVADIEINLEIEMFIRY